MDIETMIDELIAREGGYVNHPADQGGATRWGITEAVARAHGYRGEMRDLPRSQAVAIYRRLYWQGPGFDQVAERAPKVAAELFDTAVNMGPETAIGFLQRALNALNRNGRDYGDIAVDRRIGPATLGALGGFRAARGAAAEAVLVKALDALQGARYVQLAEARALAAICSSEWVERPTIASAPITSRACSALTSSWPTWTPSASQIRASSGSSLRTKRALKVSATRRKVPAARSTSARPNSFSRSWTMSAPPVRAARSSASRSPGGRASQTK